MKDIFGIAYFWAKAWQLKHSIPAPAAMIGASNFFELAVAMKQNRVLIP